MNGEIPSVPITTLAGVSSLLDLLPEMPLPSPLPQTLSNKSLLFHPRVAEEAQRLLTITDDNLLPQLVQSISQTTSKHIDLKDQFNEQIPVEHQNAPLLLSGILMRKPDVFNSKHDHNPIDWMLISRQQQQANNNSHNLHHSSSTTDNGLGSSSASTVNANSVSASISHIHGDGTANQHQSHSAYDLNHDSPHGGQMYGLNNNAGGVNANQMHSLNQNQSQQHHYDSNHDPHSAMMYGGAMANNTNSRNANFQHHGAGVNSIPMSNSKQQVNVAMDNLASSQHSHRGQHGHGHGHGHGQHQQFEVKQEGYTPQQQQQQNMSMYGGSAASGVINKSNSTSVNSAVTNANSHQQFNANATGASMPPQSQLNLLKSEINSSKNTLVIKLNKDAVDSRVTRQDSTPFTGSAVGNPSMQPIVSLTNHTKGVHRAATIGNKNYVEASGSESEEEDEDGYTRGKKGKSKSPKKERKPPKIDLDFTMEGPAIKKRKLSTRSNTPPHIPPTDEELLNNDLNLAKPRKLVVRRMLIPVLEKLPDTGRGGIANNNTYHRFLKIMDVVLDNMDYIDKNEIELDEDGNVPSELLIPKHQLNELCSEAAKLKSLGAMEAIPPEKVVRLLTILEINIRDGSKVTPLADPEDSEEDSRLWLDLTTESINRGVLSSLTALHVLTSQNMPKRVYLEDLIDRIVIFSKYQLQNTIFPTFDPVYRSGKDAFGSSKKKRAHAREVREKNMVSFYNKMHELVGLLAELLEVQVLTDTTVLHLSTLGVSPFFVESVSELQLSALKLVTAIFTQYEKHRRLLLDDILASIARLPSSKRSLRTFKLSSGSEECIQMLTALVLQLIQCVTYLPDRLGTRGKPGRSNSFDGAAGAGDSDKLKSNTERDVQIGTKYDTAMRTAANFLSVFLSKCGSKSEECDYRVLFENFIQDLLSTVNKPEWPASELLLSLLGTLLVKNLGNKSLEVSMRVASLEYLGVAASRLRKDAVSAHVKMSTIDRIIADIKAEEEVEEDPKEADMDSVEAEQEKISFLQRVLLDYLAVHGQSDPALMHARHFYIASWWKSAPTDISKSIKDGGTSPAKKTPKKKKKRRSQSQSSEEDEASEDSDIEEIPNENDGHHNTKVLELVEKRRTFLLSKIRPFSDPLSNRKTETVQTFVDDHSAELVARFLASKRPFSASFDFFLTRILSVSMEQAVAIRTKALRCLTMVVEADATVLARADMQLWVRNSFLDQSTAVREAAVDLVGKYVLSCPDLIEKYYDTLSLRILDTGVSVRKRVIKILRDICVECPTFSKIPEICVKMIRRVNDEDGIRKLVMEVFQNMWFTPVKEDPLDTASLLRKVSHITDVVASCEKVALEFFEQLLLSLFKPKDDREDVREKLLNQEPPKALVTASGQIVNCLVEHVLRTEESLSGGQGPQGTHNSQRFVACVATLVLFAKIRPQLLVSHAGTLQGYLTLKCQNASEITAVSNIANVLELVVPLLVNPSESFLSQLEEDCVKLIFKNDKTIIDACLACLGAVVNKITRNFKLVRDVFRRFHNVLSAQMKMIRENASNPKLAESRPLLRRAVYTVGLFLRYFDFKCPEVHNPWPSNLVESVFHELLYLLSSTVDAIADLQYFALQSIGNLCIRHYDFMLGNDLKHIYQYHLSHTGSDTKLKIQTLSNIQLYLVEEELRMIKQDQEWTKHAKMESIKEMGDVTSGMASTIVQIYLKQILEAFLHSDLQVRLAAVRVIQLVLQQGLVHPIQIVPYLICMSTDEEPGIGVTADKQLQEMEKKHPQFLQSQVLNGIRLSLQLQRILAGQKGSALPSTSTSPTKEISTALNSADVAIIRGYRIRPKEAPSALNGFLYSLLRSTKPQRRAIALLLLKQFDEQNKTQLSDLLYYADNLAYFPYQVVDEPLFLIHHVDIVISVAGSNLLQSFKESLSPLHPAPPAPTEPAVVATPMEPTPVEVPPEPAVILQNSLYNPNPGGFANMQDFINATMESAQPIPPVMPQNVSYVLNELTGQMEAVIRPAPVQYMENHSYMPNQIQQNQIQLAQTGDQVPANPDENQAQPSKPKATDLLEDDEDEDVESLLNRLPESPKNLEEFTIGCQGCLLLLMLKQHLKDSYGITDSRISAYSPSDASKVYERPVNRRVTAVFDPKCTISNLKIPPDATTVENRRALIEQYLHFKQLMLRIDPEEGDDDGEAKPMKVKVDQNLFTYPGAQLPETPEPQYSPLKIKIGQPTPLGSKYASSSGGRSGGYAVVNQQTPPRGGEQNAMVSIPKLTIVPLKFPGKGGEPGKKLHKIKTDHHHHHKHKKSKHKKKKKYMVSDDDDSDNTGSDPDFHI